MRSLFGSIYTELGLCSGLDGGSPRVRLLGRHEYDLIWEKGLCRFNSSSVGPKSNDKEEEGRRHWEKVLGRWRQRSEGCSYKPRTAKGASSQGMRTESNMCY